MRVKLKETPSIEPEKEPQTFRVPGPQPQARIFVGRQYAGLHLGQSAPTTAKVIKEAAISLKN